MLHPFDSDMSAEGAALFAVLAPRRRRELVPLLIAYVLLWSYVDVLTEQSGATTDARLFGALGDALDPHGPAPLYTAAMDDGGYLAALIAACREGCRQMPAWALVADEVARLAGYGANVQAINHGAREAVEPRLRAWAAGVESSAARWHELGAAASSPLAIHALIALAADPDARPGDVRATSAAYFPSMAALSVLADHYVDHKHDLAHDQHSYLDHYESHLDAGDGIQRLANAAASAVHPLRHGERHAVILAAMSAMFFSEQSAWSEPNAPTSRAVLASVGVPVAPLLAVLALKRRLADGGAAHGSSSNG